MAYSIRLWLEPQRYILGSNPDPVGYLSSWLRINSDPNCSKAWSVLTQSKLEDVTLCIIDQLKQSNGVLGHLASHIKLGRENLLQMVR